MDNSISITHPNPYAELKIGVSPRGSKYVTARNLHAALRLNPVNYSRDVKRWLEEDYGFADDIRPPREGAEGEYAPIAVSPDSKRGQAAQDYFLKLSLAKLITLNSNSPVKKEYARYLLSLEQQVEDADLLSPQQIVALLDLAKVMGLFSAQTSAESQHFSEYLEQGGSRYDWWNFRARLLGYSPEDLKAAILKMGIHKAKANATRRAMLMQTDKYELVRAGIIDLFCALGKSTRYAHNMGELAYRFAKEMKVSVWDDRGLSIDFTQDLNQNLIREVHALKKKGFAGLW